MKGLSMRLFTIVSLLSVMVFAAGNCIAAEQDKMIKAGMIGLDTSHVPAFTKLLNNPKAREELSGVRIVAAYPGGSDDIPASHDRVEGFTKELQAMGVEIVPSIEELLKRVDVVLLESVDGRPHLAQARPVILAGKPLYIDKPMAASLADAMRIFRLAKEHNVPCFSSSSLRFNSGYQAARRGETFGAIRSCTAWSPLNIEPHHPELFWYGIHGVESLFAIMGPGCREVIRVGPEKVEGIWKDGRRGYFVADKGYGAEVEGEKGSGKITKNEGYEPLVVEIVRFFKTGKPPVSPEETLEVLAFMVAAEESKNLGGKPVSIESVMRKAEQEIAEKP
jgi:hypothetical protein